MSPYIQDILSQPAMLRGLASSLENNDLGAVRRLIQDRQRVVLTGMGASFAALLPAWRKLVASGIPAWHMDTSELLTISYGLLTPGTLVIAASQSGRSAELLSLADRVTERSTLIVITNDADSPLAAAASVVVRIHSGIEHAVSTKSYLNTLSAVSAMLAGGGQRQDLSQWNRAADAVEQYLASWQERVQFLIERLGLPGRLLILGRGDSMAAALYGALIAKEAAKWPVEGMNAAQFRHGPLELADVRLTTLILAGNESLSRERNVRLAHDIAKLGGKPVWLSTHALPDCLHVEIPEADGPALAIAESIPLQLLTIALAWQSDIEPGVFRHLQKVTRIE